MFCLTKEGGIKASMQEFFFSTKGLSVGYDKVPLIKDITFGINKGEILTLIGPNGAGKSTILKSIIGQLSLISGVVFLENNILNEMTEKERAKNVSVLLTKKLSTELLTVREVVEMGRYPYTGRLGIMQEKDKEIVEHVMEQVHVLKLAKWDFMHLSDGQKQRVMLAKAMAQEPEILVLDEPVSYMDIGYQVDFLKLLRKMTKEKSLTVIMSLHELDCAEWISDKILCVKGEYVERFGKPNEIFTAEYISGLYNVSAGDLRRLGQWRGV